MRKTLSIITIVLFAAVMIFLMTYLILGQVLLPSESTFASDTACQKLSDGWTYTYEDSTVTDFTIPSEVDVETGKIYAVTCVISDSAAGFDHIMVWNRAQDISVYLDGSLVYTFTEENVHTWGLDRPYLYCLFEVPTLEGGETLRIEYTSVASNVQGIVGNIYVGHEGALFLSVAKSFQLEIVVAFFLFFIGILCIAGSIIVIVTTRKSNSVLALGAAICLIALWIAANSRLRQFVFPNVSSIRQIAFLTIGLIPTPFAMYLDIIQRRRYHYAYQTIEFLSLSCFVICLVLDLTGTMAVSVTFDYPLVLVLFLVITLIITLILDGIRKELRSYRLVAIGLLLLGVFGALECVYYSLESVASLSSTILLVGVVLFTLCALIYAIEGYGALHKEKSRALEQVRVLSTEMLETLVKTVDAKDHYTSGHSVRVAQYSKELARRLKMSPDEQKDVYNAGLLHDIGKIGISDEIINKSGKLTTDEYNTIKTHPVIGYEILSSIAEKPDIASAARWHHERYDGKGYPDGKKGEEIPQIARIICVADSYDAMTTKRSYRSALTRREVVKELVNGKGTQFDPVVVDAMLAYINEREEEELQKRRLSDSGGSLMDIH